MPEKSKVVKGLVIDRVAAVLGSKKQNSPNLSIERVDFHSLKVVVPIHAIKTGSLGDSTF
jgi:hypothetical protein